MHHRSRMPVSARVLDIVVDRVIVGRNRLESGGMRIRQCGGLGRGIRRRRVSPRTFAEARR
jgi:hypothetical protein